MSKNMYQFKIILQGIEPEIWRRIQVPDDYSFWDLHVAIQDSMGWEDCHLHEFSVIDPETEDEIFIGIPDEDEGSDVEIIPGESVKISKYFSQPQDEAFYYYDFGDDWTHEVVLEKILPVTTEIQPRCVGGERACPPEDCGGIWGYEELLEIIADPKHPQYKEIAKEWLGGNFDPEEFSAEAVKFDNPKERFKIAFDC